MLPVSLYIHTPWCIRKCPYCDFNSHKSPDTLPETEYINSLIADLDEDLQRFPVKNIETIFIGGGTPSLFSAESYGILFEAIDKRLSLGKDIEITMEANPGTMEQQRFRNYRACGINRLSLGIQSFNAKSLKILGRIHDEKQAYHSVEMARLAGFDNINLDIMHGLPQQSAEEGLQDLETAILLQPEHISWYQLTIEPNTIFHKTKPVLPMEETLVAIEEQGLSMLEHYGFKRYEISAFTKNNPSRHNLNYWLFGDYLGIGAGAHGKITTKEGIFRTRKHRQPKDYMNQEKSFLAECEPITHQSILFEFMLNTTRLEEPVSFMLFENRTGLSSEVLKKSLQEAQNLGLVSLTESGWQITTFGRRYTNDLQGLFL